MIDIAPLLRHDKVALSFSGGKDSTAALWLLREHLKDITVYHLDPGDALPETQAFVSEVSRFCPNFVNLTGDVRGWIAENGLPTDLLPHSSHGIGVMMGEEDTKLVTRYQCCFVNLMYPLWDRIKNDGNTLCIRGTKRSDMARLPAESGKSVDGIELWYPVLEWSDADVLQYLKDAGAPWSPLFDVLRNTPDCARCTAWWGESRGAWLREAHPDLADDYIRGLRLIGKAIGGPINALRSELLRGA